MSEGPMKHIVDHGGILMATCPGCGARGEIDLEQYRGEVSVDCPVCDYHETHDHREKSDDG